MVAVYLSPRPLGESASAGGVEAFAILRNVILKYPIIYIHDHILIVEQRLGNVGSIYEVA